MRLWPLALGTRWPADAIGEQAGSLRLATTLATAPCVFCGALSGDWQSNADDEQPPKDAEPGKAPPALCPVCHLARHLERPRIDEEAMLVWLPETSQAALNTLMREIHVQLRGLGDDVRHGGQHPREDAARQRALYHARMAVAARADAAAERLGTHLPSELVSALHRLSEPARARQAALLGGLRVMPLGRLFHDGADVYPAIVDAWLNQADPQPPSSAAARADASTVATKTAVTVVATRAYGRKGS